MTPETIDDFHDTLDPVDRSTADCLRAEIQAALPQATCKIWHRHPVWFLDDNPTVGYSKLKGCIRPMFWSGADFEEPGLRAGTGKFKDASARYTDVSQIDLQSLRRWLAEAQVIQWDYKNISKRKGRLERLS